MNVYDQKPAFLDPSSDELSNFEVVLRQSGVQLAGNSDKPSVT